MINTNRINNENSIAPTQIGDKTQIHFHVIIPHNFNTIKATANKPQKPIPLALELMFVFDIFLIFFLLLFFM